MAGFMDQFMQQFIPQSYGGVDMSPEQTDQATNQMLMQLGASLMTPSYQQVGPHTQQDYSAPFRAIAGLPAMGQGFAKEGAAEVAAGEDRQYQQEKRSREAERFTAQQRMDEISSTLKQFQLDETKKMAEEQDLVEEAEQSYVTGLDTDMLPPHVSEAVKGYVIAGEHGKAREIVNQWNESAYEEAQGKQRELESILMWESMLPPEDRDLAKGMVDDPVGTRAILSQREAARQKNEGEGSMAADKKYADTVNKVMSDLKGTYEISDPTSRKKKKVKGYRNPSIPADQITEADITQDPLTAEQWATGSVNSSGLGRVSKDPMWRLKKIYPAIDNEAKLDVLVNMMVNKGMFKVDETDTLEDLRSALVDQIEAAYMKGGPQGIEKFLRQRAGVGVQ